MVAYIIIAVIAYLIGSINFSVIISKRMAGFDIREKGSGNAGTTNILREVGLGAAALTLLCDILKGVLSIGIAVIMYKLIPEEVGLSGSLLIQLAGIFVILGHTFPVFFRFRGGKGVATSVGILLMTNWKIGLICLIFALILIGLTRMVSLGSIMSAILFPVLTIFISDCFIIPGSGFGYLIYSIILAILVIFNHRENIKRIMDGTENRLSLKGNKS